MRIAVRVVYILAIALADLARLHKTIPGTSPGSTPRLLLRSRMVVPVLSGIIARQASTLMRIAGKVVQGWNIPSGSDACHPDPPVPAPSQNTGTSPHHEKTGPCADVP